MRYLRKLLHALSDSDIQHQSDLGRLVTATAYVREVQLELESAVREAIAAGSKTFSLAYDTIYTHRKTVGSPNSTGTLVDITIFINPAKLLTLYIQFRSENPGLLTDLRTALTDSAVFGGHHFVACPGGFNCEVIGVTTDLLNTFDPDHTSSHWNR